MIILYVALGGAIGASLRFGVVNWAMRTLGPEIPYGTAMVNILGSFLIGAVVAWLALRTDGFHNEARAFLISGVLGGFTTFSAYSLDVVALIERRAHMEAAIYAFGSVGLSVLACVAGLMVVRGAIS